MVDIADTISADPCANDTTPPWIAADPPGGLHLSSVKVALSASEETSVEWRLGNAGEWRPYEDTPIPIEKDAHLFVRGRDTCDNAMEARSIYYEIRPDYDTAICPKGMTLIDVGQTRFCIDKYEWPNRKGARPKAYISIYQASDSCYTVGKRLCETEEWMLACRGAYGWRFPYGNEYIPHTCNTTDYAPLPSGERKECRGFFEVYDMSGNLAEWTNTRSRRNRNFYNVAGGFWDSGPQSSCTDMKYSYFPQNRHNPVGFRCCRDVE